MLKQLSQLPSPVVVFDMSAVGSTYSQSPSLSLANGEPVAGAPRSTSESRDDEPQQGTEAEGGGAPAGQERALVEAAAELHGLEAAEELIVRPHRPTSSSDPRSWGRTMRTFRSLHGPQDLEPRPSLRLCLQVRYFPTLIPPYLIDPSEAVQPMSVPPARITSLSFGHSLPQTL
jgi:hypothetical protein